MCMLMKKLFSLFFALLLVGYSFSQLDMGAVTVIVPSSPMCPDATTTITVRIRNNSAVPIVFATNNVLVSADITGASTQLFTRLLDGSAAPFSLGASATINVTLTAVGNLSAIGTHSFDISAIVAGDIDNSNDHAFEDIVVEEPVINNLVNTSCSGTLFTTTPVDIVDGSVPAGTTYDWGIPIVTGGMTGGAAGVGAASITGTLSNPTNSAQTATYTVTPTSGGASCVGTPFTVTVTVNPAATIADLTDAVCSGVLFTSTPANVLPNVIPVGTTYSWGLPSAGLLTGGSAGGPAASVSGTLTNPTSAAIVATYTVTPMSGICPGATFDLDVTVNPIPVIADDALSACSFAPFNLAPADVLPNVVPVGTTYDWGIPVVTGGLTGGASGTAETDVNGILTNPTTIAQTATYTVTPSITGCSGASFDVVVTIDPSPVVVDEATATCSGVLFTVTPVDGGANLIPIGTTYSWGLPVVTGGMTGGATGTAAASITGTLNNTTAINQTATYTVTPSLAGCDGPTFEVVVTINPLPLLADDAAATCSGVVFTHTPLNVLPDVVPLGTTYSWGLPVVTGGVTGGTTGVAQASISGTLTNPTNTSQTATYTVTPVAGGCPGTTFDLVVTVDPIPSIANDALTVCSVNPFSLTPVNGGGDIVPVGTTYSWGLPIVTGGMTGGAIGAGAVSITGTLTNATSLSQTATYTVTPSAGGCDGATFDIVVTFDPAPSIADDALAVCSSSPFSITPLNVLPDVVPAGTTYSWGIPVVTGGVTGGAAGVAQASISGTLTNPTSLVQTTTYTVTPSFSGCVGPTFDIVITVNPTPVIGDDATSVCSGIPFTVAPVNGVDVVPVGTTYDWGIPIVTGGMTGGVAGVGETDVNGTLTNPTASQQTATYTVTPSVGTCVGASFDVVVSVDALPTYLIAGLNPTACGALDGSITISGLNVSTNYDISYDDDAAPVNLGTVISTIGGTYVITGLDAGSYDNFLVTITASGCSTPDATNTVLSDPGAPIIDDIADQTLCDIGYTLPVITGVGLSGSEGYYSLPGGVAGGGINYPVGSVINTSGTTVYIYDELGLCTAQQNFTVTIFNAPIIADKAAAICSGDIFSVVPTDVLPDEVPVGTTYDWGMPIVTGGLTGGATGTAQTSISGSLLNPTNTVQTATYTVTPTADGCAGATFDVVVTVNPSSVIADDALSTCSGIAFIHTPVDVLPDVIPLGTTYDWGIPVVTGGMTGGAAGVAQTSIGGTLTNPTNIAQTATYTVTSTSGACPGTTFDLVVTINPMPDITNFASMNCSGVSFSSVPSGVLPDILPVGTTYSWMAPVVTGGVTGGTAGISQASIDGTLINPTNTAQTVTYTVSPTSGSCTGSTFDIVMTLSPAAIISDDVTSVCSGLPFSVAPVDGVGGDVVPLGTTYSWGVPIVTGGMTGGASGLAATSISGTLTNPTSSIQTATYIVTPTTAGCAGVIFNVVVTINPMPLIADDALTVCSAVAFSLTPVDGVDIVPVGTTYDWGLPVVTGGMTGGAAGVAQPLISGSLTNSTGVSQTATYTITPMSGTCAGATFDLVVTVDAAPVFSYLLPLDHPSICGASDGSITITGLTAASNYDISYDDDAVPVNLGTVVSTGGGTYVISGLNAGSYDNVVVATTVSGCFTTDAIGVSLVNPGAPDIDDIADQTLCDVGYTLPVITGTGLTGSASYYDLPGGALGGGTAYAAGAVINTTTLMYIYDGVGLCTDQENFQITINTTPLISDQALSVCTTVPFNVTPANVLPNVVPVGTTYDWGIPVVTGGITGGAAGVSAASISGTLTNPSSSVQTATYTVTPTSNGCVGAPFTLVVTVNPYPVIADDVSSSCSGVAFSLIPADVFPDVVPSGTTYDWGVPVVTGGMTGGAIGSAAASVSGTLINPTNIAQTATYTVTPSIGSCIGSTFDVVVTVNPSAIIADAVSSACSGTPFTITPANVFPDVVPVGTTYSWGAPVVTGGITGGALGAATASVSGTLTNPTNAVQTATYTVTPTSAGCSGSTFDVVVSVNPMPIIADVATAVCTGVAFSVAPVNTLPDVVPAGTTYDWGIPVVTGGITGGAAGVAAASITGTLINSSSTVQTATYTVTPTSGTCAGASFDIVVTVNPTPVVADDALSSCSGVLFSLTPANVLPDVVPVGTTYSWGIPVVTGGVTGGAAGITAASISGTLTNPTNIVQTATYTVTPISGTCSGATFDVVVTLNPIPVIADVASPVCTGVAFSIAPANVLPDVVPVGTTYDWGIPVVTGGMTGGASGLAAATINGTLINSTNTAQTATYTVTPASGTCSGVSFDVVMTVNPYPVIADVATPICSATLFTVTPTNTLPDIVPAGTTYSWGLPVVTGGVTGGATGASLANISGTLINPTNIAQTATYTVTPSIGSCTGLTFDVVVTVNPSAIIADVATPICSGTPFTITPANVFPDVVPVGTTYSWGAPVVTGGITGGALGAATASVSGTLTNPTNAVQTATYTVTPTSAGCSGSTFDVVVSVNPMPIIADVATAVCTGVVFSVAPVNTLPDVVPAGTTYDWGIPVVTGGMTGGAAGVAAASITGTLINSSSTVQTATYTVTPTSGTCVGASFDIVVTVNPTPVVADDALSSCSGVLFSLTPANVLPDVVPVGTTYSWGYSSCNRWSHRWSSRNNSSIYFRHIDESNKYCSNSNLYGNTNIWNMFWSNF
jgi:hypothetical protein